MVGVDGRLVYESLVLPDSQVLDYNTRFSGIAQKDLGELSCRVLPSYYPSISCQIIQRTTSKKPFPARTSIIPHLMELFARQQGFRNILEC